LTGPHEGLASLEALVDYEERKLAYSTIYVLLIWQFPWTAKPIYINFIPE